MVIVDLIVNIVVSLVVLAPILWISGRMLVGSNKAKFTDALWIALLGTIISAVFNYFDLGIIGSIIMLVIFLWLVKHFFDCGWLKALLISIVAVIIAIIIVFILSLFGIGIGLGLGFI